MADTKLEVDTYSADTLTIGPGVAVEELNVQLRKEGLGPLVAAPGRRAGSRRIVTVEDGQAVAAFEALPAHDLRLDKLHVSGTEFMGKGWGHGFTWSEMTMLEADKPARPAWEKLPAGLRRPVIALLDTGVEKHPWIDVGPAEDPFVRHAEDLGFPRMLPLFV